MKLLQFLRRDPGSASVEFVLAVPVVFAILFSSIDFGAVMLRQVFLDRAVDMAAREVRLGQISVAGFNDFRDRICARTILVQNCTANISIEMRPVDTLTWAGLDEPAQCRNRAQDISPLLMFVPGLGQQELMLIRVCIAADPFIRMTGLVLGMSQDDSGIYNMVARAVWVNEPP